jgi:acyl-coenzyme A synthetase/AMP-(fatty) acid ligase
LEGNVDSGITIHELIEFLDTRESAWKIVDRLLEREAVLIQEELVDLQRMLPKTEAGKTLQSTLKELAQKLKEELATPERR